MPLPYELFEQLYHHRNEPVVSHQPLIESYQAALDQLDSMELDQWHKHLQYYHWPSSFRADTVGGALFGARLRNYGQVDANCAPLNILAADGKPVIGDHPVIECNDYVFYRQKLIHRPVEGRSGWVNPIHRGQSRRALLVETELNQTVKQQLYQHRIQRYRHLREDSNYYRYDGEWSPLFYEPKASQTVEKPPSTTKTSWISWTVLTILIVIVVIFALRLTRRR